MVDTTVLEAVAEGCRSSSLLWGTILKHIGDRAALVGLNKVGAALYDPLVCFVAPIF